jgi:hypothetical protein
MHDKTQDDELSTAGPAPAREEQDAIRSAPVGADGGQVTPPPPQASGGNVQGGDHPGDTAADAHRHEEHQGGGKRTG